MNCRPAIILLGLTLLILPNRPAFGADVPQAAGVKIQADTLSYDSPSDTYQATGNVEMHWDGATLFADKALLHQSTGDADATGRVRLLKNDDTLKGDHLSINLDSQNGEAENAEMFYKQSNFHLQSRRLAKTGLGDYRLEQGTFTTCDGPSPSWKFTADKMDVTLDEYGTARHVLFYVKGIPLFYTPYLIFPVTRERQSGFLFPHIGSSDKKGFTLGIPYYWAISPSQDLTALLDVQSKRGVGLGLDYRYLGNAGSHGNLASYGIYDRLEGRGRGEIKLVQLQAIASALTFRSDLDLTSDRTFLNDYGETTGVYNRQFLDSSASVSWHRQAYLVNIEGRYADNLNAPNNRATLQRLPVVNFSVIPQRLWGGPIYAALDSQFTNFHRNDGSRGERFILNPALSFFRVLPAGLELAVQGGYQLRFYNANNAGVADGTSGVGLGWANASLATPLERVYEINDGNLKRLRHTLVPAIGYTLTQERNQENLPLFDYDDRPLGQQLLGWSLTSYLTGRYATPSGAPDYRELLFLRLSQGYQLSGSRRDLLNLADDDRDRLTDLRLEMRANPDKRLTVSLDSRYNPGLARISTVSAGFDLTDGSGNFAGASYFYARNRLGYLEGRLGLTLVKPFIFNYTPRYSFDKGEFLESLYTLEYRQQCWSLDFSYQDRPGNRSFLVSFTLSGLGSFGKIRPF
ncbi:LPS-assembly protein LptD [Geobacter sp. AOG1]|uniref:LPS-assembly protein LptD n=1 Tax=Geobacter sp. AOG1 TaxID=1566346 RepID=UPI001CC3DE99|nr:LPS assembly protein LptD [Geobacter sp. AOG1]